MSYKNNPIESSVESDRSKYQAWPHEIFPVEKARAYFIKSGFFQDCESMINIIHARIINAKDRQARITKAYIFTAVVNQVRDKIRRKKAEEKRKERERIAAKANPEKYRAKSVVEKLLEDEEFCQQNQMLAAVFDPHFGNLDLRTRVILKLRHLAESPLKFRRIAIIVGYSESRVRQKYQWGINQLNKVINQYYRQEEE